MWFCSILNALLNDISFKFIFILKRCVFGAKSQLLSKFSCCVFDLARGWFAEVGATASARSVPANKAGQAKHATARLTPSQIKWDTV